MSFGFSVGDFVAVTKLIADVVSSLRTSSTSAYRELIIELHNLERALNDIEYLECDPEQAAAVTSVKVTALTCRFPLDEFAIKLKKFHCLQEQRTAGTRHKIDIWRLKLECGFTMEEEVQRLRTYLVMHMGSLNMRLTTLGLATQTAMSKAAIERHTALEDGLTATHVMLQDIQSNLAVQKSLAADNKSRLECLATLITTSLLPVLVQLAHHVWTSNVKLMALITWQQNHLQSPNSGCRWQVPAKFEDACGRILPIPSDFNWGKVHAIILEQFRAGPGKQKVSFGEYDLYDTTNRIRRITSQDYETLMPGMSITMAMRVGMYGFGISTGCPNPACKSNAIAASKEGGRRCSACQVWHSISSQPPPQPFRSLASKVAEHKKPSIQKPSSYDLVDAFKEIRIERMAFKNMQIYMTDLPTVQSVLDNDSVDLENGGQRSKGNMQDWNRSTITFEYPADAEATTSSSLIPSSSPMLTHRLFNNFQYIPMNASTLALNLISEEVGLQVAELSATTRFDEVGLDSLLSLSAVGQLREEGLELPTSIFWDFPTVQELEAFLDRPYRA